MSWLDRDHHRRWLETECRALLELGRGARVDGGFGWLGNDGVPDARRPLELWITTRMTHVFALGHLLGEPGCGPLADHGLGAIRATFEDREHGGWFSRPGETGKAAYDHAFVLLAAASATVAGRAGARELLDAATAVVDARFWDEQAGACAESWDRAWRTPEPYRGANSNMHMVEAFLAVRDATADDAWARRALRIAERLIDGGARRHEWRVVEHFGASWHPVFDYNADRPRDPFRPYGVTPGHGLEWSRLLLGLRAALPDPPGWLEEAARALFDRAVADGWDRSAGGFAYTTDSGGRPVVRERFHWVLAEGIGAAATLLAATGEAAYEECYRTFWDFADVHLRDRRHGGWHHELDAENQPSATTWVGKPDLYHAVQATLIPRLGIAPSLAGALR